MKKHFLVILILIIFFNFSCIGKKTTIDLSDLTNLEALLNSDYIDFDEDQYFEEETALESKYDSSIGVTIEFNKDIIHNKNSGLFKIILEKETVFAHNSENRLIFSFKNSYRDEMLDKLEPFSLPAGTFHFITFNTNDTNEIFQLIKLENPTSYKINDKITSKNNFIYGYFQGNGKIISHNFKSFNIFENRLSYNNDNNYYGYDSFYNNTDYKKLTFSTYYFIAEIDETIGYGQIIENENITLNKEYILEENKLYNLYITKEILLNNSSFEIFEYDYGDLDKLSYSDIYKLTKDYNTDSYYIKSLIPNNKITLKTLEIHNFTDEFSYVIPKNSTFIFNLPYKNFSKIICNKNLKSYRYNNFSYSYFINRGRIITNNDFNTGNFSYINTTNMTQEIVVKYIDNHHDIDIHTQIVVSNNLPLFGYFELTSEISITPNMDITIYQNNYMYDNMHVKKDETVILEPASYYISLFQSFETLTKEFKLNASE